MLDREHLLCIERLICVLSHIDLAFYTSPPYTLFIAKMVRELLPATIRQVLREQIKYVLSMKYL